MKHLILGTAGHIDHGKTALIKALTGIECDTHREEKKRGITINLGFAHLPLSTGDTVSIIDVPGHRDFVHTMVAGASGIDFALLVVAADSGVMPQTREHLQIMEMLGIGSGLIAITRTDLTEPDVISLAEEEIKELVHGTFLQDSPIIRASSKTHEGITSLRSAIETIAVSVTDRPKGEVFRMYIDRIFSVAGFGTVVTGSVLGGTLRADTKVYLLPPEKPLRIRRMERHGKEVSEITAGDRASLNLVGLSKEEFSRGMVITDRLVKTSTMIDAKVRLFEHSRPLGIWSSVLFLTGTYEAQSRLHLIDRNKVRGGEEGIVQIHLPVPCIVQPKDRFILRNTSNNITLGGGTIVDPSPLHHRRRPPELIETLQKISEGGLKELVAAEIRKQYHGVSIQTIADTLNVAPKDIHSATDQDLPSDILRLESAENYFFITRSEYKKIAHHIPKQLSSYHRRNPLVETGRTIEELLGMLGIPPVSEAQHIVGIVLNELEQKRVLKRVSHTWALSSHDVTDSADSKSKIATIESRLKNNEMKTPLWAELLSFAEQQGIDERMLKQIVRYLVEHKKAYAIEGNYLHASIVDSCRTKLLQALKDTPEGITVAGFRDLVHGNRKICLLLLAIYEKEDIVERQENVRVLTKKGKVMATE